MHANRKKMVVTSLADEVEALCPCDTGRDEWCGIVDCSCMWPRKKSAPQCADEHHDLARRVGEMDHKATFLVPKRLLDCSYTLRECFMTSPTPCSRCGGMGSIEVERVRILGDGVYGEPTYDYLTCIVCNGTGQQPQRKEAETR